MPYHAANNIIKRLLKADKEGLKLVGGFLRAAFISANSYELARFHITFCQSYWCIYKCFCGPSKNILWRHISFQTTHSHRRLAVHKRSTAHYYSHGCSCYKK